MEEREEKRNKLREMDWRKAARGGREREWRQWIGNGKRWVQGKGKRKRTGKEKG